MQNENSRKEFIIEIQNLYKQGYSKTQIAMMLKTTRGTIRKYIDGNPDNLCIHGKRKKETYSLLDEYQHIIVNLLSQKMMYKDIFEILVQKGYKGKKTILFEYCKKCKMKYKIVKVPIIPRKYINRQEIIKHIWSKKEIDEKKKVMVYKKYPALIEVEACVVEFRNIYEKSSIPLLHSFLEKYSNSEISHLKTFANGIKKDIQAVEASIKYSYSNGFLEGNNNRLKVIKRIMYGRAKLPLLRIKVLSANIFLSNNTQN